MVKTWCRISSWTCNIIVDSLNTWAFQSWKTAATASICSMYSITELYSPFSPVQVKRTKITMLIFLFHIFDKNDQLNKIVFFLLIIFVEMRDKKKILLLEWEDKYPLYLAMATMMRWQFHVVDSLFWHKETETKNLYGCQEIRWASLHWLV